MGLRPVVLTLFLCSLWGGLGPSIKLSLQGMPPVAVAAWRFLVGLVCLLVWCRVYRIDWRLPRRDHLALFIFGLIFVAQISILNFGTKFTTSNHSVLFLATNPLWVALLAHFVIPNDRLNVSKVAGLLLAFLGICVTFMDSGQIPTGNPLLGDLLVLVSGCLLGVIQIYSKFLVRRLSSYQIIVWELMYGVPLYFILTAVFERNIPYHLTPAVVAGVLYQGIVVAAFCFVTWTNLLQRYAASKLSAFQFTTPIFGVVLSWLVLGDTTTPWFVIGVALVAAGIYLVSKLATYNGNDTA